MTSTVFLLSAKSSGSSAVMRHLAASKGVNLVPYNCHGENETLYWTKAGSILGLPQSRLPYSEVPFSRRRALTQLRAFVARNLSEEGAARDLQTEAGLFEAWSRLAHRYGPVLVEKSPHHLYQPAVIELMERYADNSGGVDVHFLGLIRNPIDTFYSSWRRFGVSPRAEERHWIRAYTTLLELARRRPAATTIIRYEDVVRDHQPLGELVTRLLGTNGPIDDGAADRFHARSVQKWRSDRKFGFSLDAASTALAKMYGYTDDELTNDNAHPWSWHEAPRVAAYTLFWMMPNGVTRRLRFAARMVVDALRSGSGSRHRNSGHATVAGGGRIPRRPLT